MMVIEVCFYRVSCNEYSVEALPSAAAVNSGSMTNGRSTEYERRSMRFLMLFEKGAGNGVDGHGLL